jgi:hypothetical protein
MQRRHKRGKEVDMENERTQKAKGGRPPKAVKKEKQTGIRFTAKEYFIIKQKAILAGMSRTAYIRRMAIHGKVLARLTDEDRQIARGLIGMAPNINQIAKCCHKEGVLSAMLIFKDYKDQIDDFLKRLKHDQ